MYPDTFRAILCSVNGHAETLEQPTNIGLCFMREDATGFAVQGYRACLFTYSDSGVPNKWSRTVAGEVAISREAAMSSLFDKLDLFGNANREETQDDYARVFVIGGGELDD